MTQWKLATLTAVAASCAVFLAGCGGASDGADTTPRTTVSSVKVFGDSLVDSGAFGYKFTIQSSDSSNPFLVFSELVAANVGVSKLCSFFNFNGTTFVPNTNCTNFAVGGGRVNNLSNSSSPSSTNPFSIPYQMATASSSLTANDLVIVDGGGNDLSDLIGAYLLATTPAGVTTYTTMLSTLLPATTVSTLIGSTPTSTTMALAAGAYAQAAGQALAASVRNNVLIKGVSKVVVVNAPDITVTPRFTAVLAQVAATAGSAKRDAVQTAARAWVQAYNAGLAQGLTGTNVQLFDLYTEGNRITSTPAQFALTNVTTPSCPQVTGGVDNLGLANLGLAPTVAACNSASMSANIPVGQTSANWWQGYAYSDNFHPTPALHKLISQSISLQLARAGWL